MDAFKAIFKEQLLEFLSQPNLMSFYWYNCRFGLGAMTGFATLHVDSHCSFFFHKLFFAKILTIKINTYIKRAEHFSKAWFLNPRILSQCVVLQKIQAAQVIIFCKQKVELFQMFFTKYQKLLLKELASHSCFQYNRS